MLKKFLIRAALCAIFMLGIYVFSGTLFFPASVDLGWHWALIDFVRENGHAPKIYSPMLRVMSDYPPLTHSIGAVASIFAGSGLMVMHIMGLVAVIFVYVIIAYELPVLGGVIFSLGALELGRRRLMVGHEVVENYFFAQLITTAIALILLKIVLRIEDKRWQSAAAVAGTVLLGWAFPMIAAVFAVGVGFVWLCDVVRPLWQKDLPTPRSVLALGAVATLLILSVVVSPFFLGMISNAGHDGTMQSGLRPGQVGLLGLAVAVVALWFGSRFGTRGRVIVAAAGGFGLVACVQWLALLKGIGSPYAVLKLSFGVGTFGLAVMALAMTSFGGPRVRSPLWRPMLAVTIVAAVFYANSRVTPARDLNGFLAYEQAVRELAAQSPELRNTMISANRDFDGALNWSVSLVALAAEYGVGVDQLGAFGFELLPDERSPGARFAALPTEQAKKMPDSCLVSTTPRVSVVKLECGMRKPEAVPR